MAEVRTTLVAAEPDFDAQPTAVAEPFGLADGRQNQAGAPETTDRTQVGR